MSSGRVRTQSEESSDGSGWSCVVCCQKVPGPNRKGIYAIGACEHPVCYECSTKMRVLCQQTECPICRQDITQVIFTRNRRAKYAERNNGKYIYINEEYNIVFENEEALQAYGKLLETKCRICRTSFTSFANLEKHLQEVHDMYFCELCVKHLKIFSHERKCYNRKDLLRHRKYGDPDDRSHRGHPLCKFCDIRFLDDEDLHKHLRRDHFYCHFCDPGGQNQFYENYPILKDHFRNDHYLCEEGPCAEEQFTTAFKTEIDYQAHRAYVHCHTKSESKNARTLNLDFRIKPQRQRQNNYNSGSSYSGPSQIQERQKNKPASSSSVNVIDVEDDPFANVAVGTTQELPRPEDFPVLATSAGAPAPVSSVPSNTARNKSAPKQKSTFSTCVGGRFGAFGGESDEFPALCGAASGPALGSVPEQYSMSSVAARLSSNKNSKITVIKNNFSANNNKSSSKNHNLPSSSSQTKANNNFAVQNDDFPALPTKQKNGKSNTKKKKKNIVSNATENKQPTQKPASQVVESAHPKNPNASKSTPTPASPSASHKKPSSQNDFPPLDDGNSTSSLAPVKPKVTPKPPPGLAKMHAKVEPMNGSCPPPGYSANGIDKSFEISLSSVAQQVITNASLESEESAQEQRKKKEFDYVPPLDFDERNQALVKEVSSLLKKKFDSFKKISKEFRQEQINGEDYWRECLNLFGKNYLPKIFPELLVLLPDIRKQNELLLHYEAYQKNLKGAVPKRTNTNGGLWVLKPDYEFDFLVCPTCRQILAKKDGSYHMTLHENSKTNRK